MRENADRLDRQARRLIYLAFWALSAQAYAYETGTHQLITDHAVERSVLQTEPSVLIDLGLTSTDVLPNSLGERLTVRGLLVFGSRQEDAGLRATRHFYNPITGSGLNAGLYTDQIPSPDWALAPVGTFTGVLTQSNSYWDGRQALLTALTASAKTQREQHFGVAFQSLGQVVHHLQDMAQPQHVRNDAHCSLSLLCFGAGLSPNPSLYESWTNAIRSTLGLRLDPGFAGYDITASNFARTFNSPRRFWHTAPPGPGAPLSGQGMAEFSSRNFVSAGTNFGRPSMFALPALDPTRSIELSIGELCANSLVACPSEVIEHSAAKLTLFGSTGHDTYLGVPIPFVATSTESMFDQYLRPSGARAFALNRFNFDEFHNHLLPRAVAFSAGLINYFFRGKLDYVPDPAQPGRFLIQNLGPEAMEGEFRLYYDTADGTRKPVLDRQGEGVVWQTQGPLAALTGAMSVTQEFDPPADAKTANRYMLVFTGTMGEERPGPGQVGAVVAKLIGAVATGLVVTPNYLPADGIAGTRLISFNGEEWILTSESARLAGNVDWKGAYVNGKPTKVLSWNGPRSRYFVAQGNSPFRPEIFQGGELWSVAPGPVLGAAIARDAVSGEWLVAVVGVANRDTVYRRPNKKSASAALYDPVSAPEGWQLVGERARDVFTAFSPWFFNGPGREGQTVDKITGRIKVQLTISGPTSAQAIFTALGGASAPQQTPPSTTVAPFGKQFQTLSSCENNTVRFTSGQGTETISTVFAFNDAITLAADYVDAEEMLSRRIVRRSSLNTVRHYVEELPDSFIIYDQCPSQSPIKQVLHHVRSDRVSISESTWEEEILLGNLVIPSVRFSGIGTNRRLRDGPAQHSPFPEVLDVEFLPGASCTDSVVTDSDQAHEYILHMDLREGALVIYRHERTGRRQSFAPNCGFPSSGEFSSHKELVDVWRNGVKTSLSLGTFNGTLPECTLFSCKASEDFRFGVVPDHDLGYGTDGAGDNAFSLRFRRRIIPPLNNFVFNFLDHGDLPGLIPAPVAGPAYYPIGVTR